MSGSAKELYDSLGALYFGATMTMSLWGIATLQMYYYYNRYSKDALWIKSLVFLVWALDTVHQALILEAGNESLVTNYDNLQFLVNAGDILKETAIFSILITEIVHLFLLFRIWILSKKNIKLVISIAVVITMETTVSILDLTQSISVKQFADIKPYAWLEKLYFSVMAATDTTIALTLMILLHRSRTGFRNSDNIINRLIIFTVNTGAIPSLLSLLAIVMNVIYPDNLIWFSLYLLISKVYTNTLLATFNAREYGAELLHSPVSNSIPGVRKDTSNDMDTAFRVETTTSHRSDDNSLGGCKLKASGLSSALIDMV